MVKYKGGVNKGNRDGHGTEYWPNGNKRFYGFWKNGFMESSSIDEDTYPNVTIFLIMEIENDGRRCKHLRDGLVGLSVMG
jgi:antitoxin component YwqK of YwqJK toxin-antitoxin module